MDSSCFGDKLVTQNTVIRLFAMSPDLAKPTNRWLPRFSLRSLLLITVVCAFGAFYFGCKLNAENFDAIKTGMTQKQVERLLGGSPGHYGRYWGPSMMTLEGVLIEGRKEVWTDDDTMLEVFFDEDSKAVGKHKRSRFHRYSLISHWLRGEFR